MVSFQRAMRLFWVSVLLVPTATAFVVPRSSATTSRSPMHPVKPHNRNTIAFIPTPSSSQLQSLPPTLLSDASIDGNSLLTFFLQTLIANGVPAVLTVGVIAFAAATFRPKKNPMETNEFLKTTNPVADLYNDLYGDQDQGKNQMLPKFFGGPQKESVTLPKNSGVPEKQFITMKHINRQLDSYKYSLTAATKSKAEAAAQFRQSSFERALGKSVSELPASVLQDLQKAEQEFLKKGSKLVAEIQKLQTELTQHAVDEEMQALGMEAVYQLDPPTNKTDVKVVKDGFRKTDKLQELNKAQREVQQLELDFVKKVIQAVGPNNAASIRTALLGDIAARGSGGLLLALQERPLTQLFSPDAPKPALFVSRFPGDTSASQVKDLREEVTAIVRSAKPGDEALVVLQSGGGTVTGYGLAASQLLRFKEAGMKLTIAVEQVAASGGYMMACVADHIIASPFAVLGSIGVITDIPNVYERLKEEGVEFQTVTAGKFKRTLTPTKKVTKEDFLKTKEDVEDIFELFRDFVAQHRPQLDIDKVATGETWFGEAALERKLCDEIKSVDDVVTDYVDQGYDVFEVDYTPPPEKQLQSLGKLLPAGESQGIVGRGIRWLVRTISSELKSELGTGLDINDSVEKRYMAKDDTADRTKMQG